MASYNAPPVYAGPPVRQRLMRNFRRTVWLSWPYRYRLLASIFCALLVAALWGLNLSAIYPILRIFKDDKNLQQWVDDEIQEHEKQYKEREKKLDDLNNALRQLELQPQTPDREKEKR